MYILLLYLYIEYPKASESNIRYRQWVTWILLSLIIDVVATRMTDYGYMIPPFVNILTSTFYFIITSGSFWGLARYLHSIIKGRFSNFYMNFINVLAIVYSIFMLINIYTGWVFTFNENGEYLHGPYYAAIFIFQALCHILSITLLISDRKKLEKRQAEQQALLEATKQTASILVLDKKKLKVKESGLPKAVIEQTPWYMKRAKLPIVKAKVGPKIVTMIADDKAFLQLPVKTEAKVVISGIYITEVKSVRGGIPPLPKKKKGFLARFKKEA